MSLVLSWPCIATMTLCFLAKPLIRPARLTFEDAVMYLVPSAFAISIPCSISSSVFWARKL